jgi:hypothetical protein
MKNRQWNIRSFLVIFLSFISILSFTQTPAENRLTDVGSISVFTVQNIKFGAFTQGISGGTVIIANDGSRSATGEILPLNLGSQYFQAIFEIEAPIGTIISIINGPDATLTGSNGGSMSLQIGTPEPLSPFNTVISPPGRTQVSIGGKLTVGNLAVSPPGNYSGTFFITFNQE